MVQWVKDPALSAQVASSGIGSVPGPRTSACHRYGKKKKKKFKGKAKRYVYVYAHIHVNTKEECLKGLKKYISN